ncbi:MAG: division/cell wall cluster transcriptional repressor MraZ [Salinisphaeraceae bacterium]|uniref:Transcriptional regulator MraZ n=2 Tax=Spectribacter TaxID=3160928 RepID=A0ABU3BX38_9GAMM|nr:MULTISPECIES: division/cell wall cluster transcriptional repressor MraZ [unclassified Salinisphaera]MDT0618088.1 division/cell wall cluster transcriptional repressor MraZ [Salinisphaera sp. P385]MDT0633866.1 division/cell wall cluster transcriptional repressor MraZ [Salinisphaera sp. W335]
MFRGSSPVTVDAKGRFAIPSAYRQPIRDACGGRIVVTQHWDRCLLIYPQPQFQAFESELLSRGGLNPKVRDIQRFLLGNARDLEMDKQGRLLLPSPLRGFAGIDSRAVLMGVGNLFELWAEDDWQARNDASCDELAAQAAAGALPDALQDLPL